MMNIPWVEWLGYLASIVVLISLLMSSLVKLRWINLAGAALFALYGAMIGALPVAFVNAAIALIDIYYLYLHYSAKERFGLVEAETDSELFNYFVESYREEIEKFTPLSRLKECRQVYYPMRNSEIAGILAGYREGDSVEILIDFVIPRYRDYKLGRYLFIQHPEVFTKHGIHRIREVAPNEAHADYLAKMGFEKVADKENLWEKKL